MDTLAFLTKVLPEENLGTYVATIAAPDFKDSSKTLMFNRGFDSIQQLANFVLAASAKRHTAYFALATFANNLEIKEDGKRRWRRKASMAQSIKTFAIDIDCGADKPYRTQREGIVALAEFLKTSGLARPLVVSSGYGLHCYWPLTSSISVVVWQGAAEQLKMLCAKHGLHIDESKVCDPAMVLRPVGTSNYKHSSVSLVSVLKDSDALPPDQILTILNAGKRAAPIKQTQHSRLLALMDAAEPVYAPADASLIIQKCAQLRRITHNNGSSATEPEWYAALGVAAFCNDADTVAIEWSRGHETFNADATRAKMAQWVASVNRPTTCAQFDKLAPGICGNCPVQGRIGSPVRLGRPAAPELKSSATDSNTPHPFDDPPAPFKRTEQGIVIDLDGTPLSICAYDVFPSHIVHDPANGYDEAVWYWKRPFKGYVKMRTRLAHVFSDGIAELNNTLADNGLLIETRIKQNYMGAYMRAYIQKLQKTYAATELYTSFGWKRDASIFVIGSTEFRREENGEVTSHEVGISKLLIEKRLDTLFDPKGDLGTWITWTKLLQAPGLEGHQFALGLGFAAPLVALTALNGFCVSLLGAGGEGKSTMQSWINSIYGDPYRLGMKKEDTKLAIVQRMGMVANLPVTIDECTFLDDAMLADITYWATQGQDKNRANEVVASNWALPVILSTNKSLRDKLMAFSADSDAMSMRLLEFTFHDNKVFGDTHDYGRRVSEMLRENYGHAGRRYIQYLMSIGAETLRKRILAQVEALQQRYGVKFAGKERYWMLTMCLADLGNELAAEAGLIRYDYHAGTEWALYQIGSQREYVAAAQVSAYDMLASYINHNIGTALTVVYRPNGAAQVAEPIPRVEVFIRKEIVLDNKGDAVQGTLYLDRRHFQRWLVGNGFDFKKATETFFSDAVEIRPNTSGKISMGKNTPLRLGQVPVLALTLNNPKLSYMLDMPLDHVMPQANVVALRK